jgi:hypothetical protein
MAIFIRGEWADVPRGATASSGTIILGIWHDAAGRRLERVPEETTGGFGSSTWLPTGSLLEPQNVADLAGRVHRYDVKLGQNNPPCRVLHRRVGMSRAACGTKLASGPLRLPLFHQQRWDIRVRWGRRRCGLCGTF